MYQDSYDAIVIGGGHAGCEAALSCSRLGIRTLMLNLNIDNTALMPCNPSIGGPAKGHLVREVSALGGEQARAADESTLMIRWLNTSKGAAVRALRAQCDPFTYSTYYRKLLTAQQNLDIHQDEATEILTDSGKISGVMTRHGSCYSARAIVICGGVYMAGRVFMGNISFASGPMGQPNSQRLADSLSHLGIVTGKMRTDTTPRLNINTINFDGMTRNYPRMSRYALTFSEKGSCITIRIMRAGFHVRLRRPTKFCRVISHVRRSLLVMLKRTALDTARRLRINFCVSRIT